MPIIEDFAPFPNTRILIWQITETVDILLSKIQLDNSSQQIWNIFTTKKTDAIVYEVRKAFKKRVTPRSAS